MLPNMVLDQILDAAELFPPEIVKKSAGRVGRDSRTHPALWRLSYVNQKPAHYHPTLMSGDDNELVFATLSQLRCFYALGCALL